MHRCRLAGTVRTNQRADLAVIDFEGDSLDCFNHAIAHDQIFHFQHIH